MLVMSSRDRTEDRGAFRGNFDAIYGERKKGKAGKTKYVIVDGQVVEEKEEGSMFIGIDWAVGRDYTSYMDTLQLAMLHAEDRSPNLKSLVTQFGIQKKLLTGE